MRFLPVVERELRVTARRHSTHVARLVIALAAMLVGLFFFVAPLPGRSRLVAERTFWGLSVLALAYCLYSGRRSTADCLSQEKREGTLGLLFLTDLKGYDVVLGKLAATSLNGLYCLMGTLPVLAVPLLLGGISYSEFWRMVLVLLNSFFFALAVGVFASVLSRHARRAYGANLALLVLIAGVPAAIAGAIAFFSPSHRLIHPLLYSCPAYPFYLCADARYGLQKLDFWCSVGLIHGLTWFLVATTSKLVTLTWRDEPSAKTTARWRALWREWLYGNTSVRSEHRRQLLNVNAYYWLASRARRKSAGVWLFLASALGWWVFVRWQLGGDGADEAVMLFAAMVLNGVLKVWVGIETGQRLAEDHQAGALELLFSTPLSARGILHGQWLALRRLFLKPMLAVVTVELVLAFVLSRRDDADASFLAAVGIVGAALLLLDSIAVAWVAMASALTTKSPNQATVQAIWRVLMLPWVLFGVFWLIAITAAVLFGKREFEPRFYLHLWFWVGLGGDLAYGIPAWWKLRHRFQELALRRFASPAAGVPHPVP
jgi:hypothetical protein